MKGLISYMIHSLNDPKTVRSNGADVPSLPLLMDPPDFRYAGALSRLPFQVLEYAAGKQARRRPAQGGAQ
jgi:hypothetical protein